MKSVLQYTLFCFLWIIICTGSYINPFKNGETNTSCFFSLPCTSFFLFLQGIIKTALPDMSRENREQYQVVIQAKDMGGQMGGLSGTTTVNITLTDVNDNPPRFPQSMEHLRVLLLSKETLYNQLFHRCHLGSLFFLSLFFFFLLFFSLSLCLFIYLLLYKYWPTVVSVYAAALVRQIGIFAYIFF